MPSVIMIASAAVRLWFLAVYRPSGAELILQSVPVAACVLFAASDIADRKNGVFASVVIECVFFALKALRFGTAQMILCIVLYAAVCAAAFFTLYGFLRKKPYMWLLVGSALAVHIVMDAYELLFTGAASDMIPYIGELSVLLIMVALTWHFISFQERAE